MGKTQREHDQIRVSAIHAENAIFTVQIHYISMYRHQMKYQKADHSFGKSRPEYLEIVRRESVLEGTLIAGKRTSLNHSEMGKPRVEEMS